GPGPHHAVERGQLADGVRGHQHRTAPHAGVAVGRVRRVELVGTPDPADRLAPRDRVAELEREVARDAEAVGDPLACEPSDDVIRDGGLLTHRVFSYHEILLSPRMDRPAHVRRGPDPARARGRPDAPETAPLPGDRKLTLEGGGTPRRTP